MGWQYVIVSAWVPQMSPGVPTHPIVIPPPQQPPGPVDPGYGYPERPVDPGYGYPQFPVDPGYGIPGPPYYRPEHPIVLPPEKPPVPPLGIWGGANEPFPTPPIYLPPTPPGGGVKPPDLGYRPEHPIYYPPGIWGGANEPFPTPPIYLPPVGGGGPGVPPTWPPLPILPPEEERPEHPEVPDLNTGSWLWITDGETYKRAFVPAPLVVTHPDYNPNYPPEATQPGTWVTIVYGGRALWAWVPSSPSDGGDTGNGGDEQKVSA